MAQLQQIVYGRFVGNGHSSGCLWRHEIESARDVSLHVLAMNNGIQHSMLQQELAGLETLWEFLADGLLNHARSGKTYQSSRLGDVQIAQHGVRSGHTAGR